MFICRLHASRSLKLKCFNNNFKTTSMINLHFIQAPGSWLSEIRRTRYQKRILKQVCLGRKDNNNYLLHWRWRGGPDVPALTIWRITARHVSSLSISRHTSSCEKGASAGPCWSSWTYVEVWSGLKRGRMETLELPHWNMNDKRFETPTGAPSAAHGKDFPVTASSRGTL